MRIPLGNFGEVAPAPQPTGGPRFAPGGTDAVGQAVERLGNTGMQLADNAMQVQAQLDAETRRQAEAMARAEAADKLVGYELEVKQATHAFTSRMQAGDVPYQQAPHDYEETLSKIQRPKVDLPPDLAVRFETGLKRIRGEAALSVADVADQARHADFKGRFAGVLDKLGKLAGMPGADVDKINAQAEAFKPLAQQAGLNPAQIDKALQDFKDQNWTQQATQRAMFARNDVGALQQVAHDLTDEKGFYADKLDANKRNAILGQVLSRQQALQDRADHAQDRLDAKGERTLAQIDQQIASGVPATPEMWAAWATNTQDTSSAAAFQDRVKGEQEVQSILRLAPDAQQQYIQQKEAKLQSEGGSVREKANVDRLKTAVTANLKQLQEQPLLYNQARMGDAVEPLGLQSLASPDGANKVGQQLQDRAAIITGMRKRYGDQVAMNLLLPQEVDALKSTLGQATPREQAGLFATMQKATADDQVYQAVMQQIAPSDPVLAYAGMVAARDTSLTTATHWFKPDESVKSPDVAATMLEGAKLLNASKKDGQGKFPLPPEKDFRDLFTSETGALFAGRPGAADVAMQAVRAYYTGKAAADGDVSGMVDTKRLQEAIKVSLGNVVDVNGSGEVLAPWGMTPDDFENGAETAFKDAVKAGGLPDTLADQWGAYGLKQAGGSTYYVTQGRSFLYDAHGQPVTITVGGDTAAGSSTAPTGMVTPGNIDIHHRPTVRNADGTISTVRSISIEVDGKEVLIPTVVGNRVVSNSEAIKHYKQTGEHLGVFDTVANANAYAESLHQQQAREYGGGQ